MPNKVLIMLTSGPDTPTRLETLFSQADDRSGTECGGSHHIIHNGWNRLLEKGVADQVYVKDGAEQNVYEAIQLAKESGVKLYVCPSSLHLHNLTLEDCIPELDGAMGSSGFTTLGMQEDVVVFCY